MGYVDEGRDAAQRLRHELDLGVDAISQIFHLMEDMGIAVFRQPLGEGSVDGLLLMSEDVTAVLINSDCVGPRQCFTAAHELGHRQLDAGHRIWVDQDVTGPQVGIAEKRANVFAAHFLMPEAGVRGVLTRMEAGHVTTEAVVHVQRHFGVSYPAAVWHLCNCGLVEKRDVARMLTVKPEVLALRLGYTDQVTDDHEARGQRSFSREYVRRAIAAYSKGVISDARVAELFRAPPDEVVTRLRENGIAPPAPGPEL
jgi:Zn-dependent peptidase ImmA (M78 family)